MNCFSCNEEFTKKAFASIFPTLCDDCEDIRIEEAFNRGMPLQPQATVITEDDIVEDTMTGGNGWSNEPTSFAGFKTTSVQSITSTTYAGRLYADVVVSMRTTNGLVDHAALSRIIEEAFVNERPVTDDRFESDRPVTDQTTGEVTDDRSDLQPMTDGLFRDVVEEAFRAGWKAGLSAVGGDKKIDMFKLLRWEHDDWIKYVVGEPVDKAAYEKKMDVDLTPERILEKEMKASRRVETDD